MFFVTPQQKWITTNYVTFYLVVKHNLNLELLQFMYSAVYCTFHNYISSYRPLVETVHS